MGEQHPRGSSGHQKKAVEQPHILKCSFYRQNSCERVHPGARVSCQIQKLLIQLCPHKHTHKHTETVLGLCPVATSDCCHTSGDMWMDKVTFRNPSSSPFLPMPPPPPPLSFHFLQLPLFLFKHWKESVLIYMWGRGGVSCLKLPPRPCDSQLLFFFPPHKKRTKVSEWMNVRLCWKLSVSSRIQTAILCHNRTSQQLSDSACRSWIWILTWRGKFPYFLMQERSTKDSHPCALCRFLVFMSMFHIYSATGSQEKFKELPRKTNHTAQAS